MWHYSANENKQVIHVLLHPFSFICVFLTQSCKVEVHNCVNPNSWNPKNPNISDLWLKVGLSELCLRKLTQAVEKRENSR